ncbi:hypothetical protein ES703_04115 [subsurface metagenome]
MGAGAELWIWDKENKKWVPLAGTAAGAMSIHAIVEKLDDIEDVDLTGLADGFIIYWDAASSTWKCTLVSATKLVDADADTKVDVEEGADEDIVRMDVAGVEAFHLSAAGILTLAKQSGAKGYKSAADQVIPTGVNTKVVLDAEEYDIQNEFDPVATYRFTVDEAGMYLVTAICGWLNVPGDKRYVTLVRKNGGALISCSQVIGSVASWPIILAVVLSELAVGDFLELFCYQGSGADATLRKGKEQTHLAVQKVG